MEPSRLHLGQDEFSSVVFAIVHKETGNANVPIVLSVNRGRAAVLNVKWTTLETQAPVLVTRGPVQVSTCARRGYNRCPSSPTKS